MMHTLIVKAPGVKSVRRYERILKKRNQTFDTLELDTVIPWIGNNPSPVFLESLAAEVFKKRGVSVDAIQIFIKPDDWHDKSIRGRHYHKARSGYRVSITKMDRLYWRTAQHEDDHKYDNIVEIYTGIRLESVVNVADWDDGVVHGEDPKFTRYETDTAYDIIYPYLKKALERRKLKAELRSLYMIIIERLREKILELKQRDHVILIDQPKSNAVQMYDAMLASVGMDASPADLAPDELGCAETVSEIARKVIPKFPRITGTWTLWDYLRKSNDWTLVDTPEPGDILISPTGTSSKGSRRPFVGHTGYVGQRSKVYSNDSFTGNFEQNFTLESWSARYEVKGGYPIYYFRAK